MPNAGTSRKLIDLHNICHKIVHRHRHVLRSYSTPSNPETLPLSAAAKLTNRRLVSLQGRDAPKFLQGIITNNVSTDGTLNGLFAAFLTAQGKVLNDVFIYRATGSAWQRETIGNEEAGYIIEVDGNQADKLLKHLKRHKLRSKLSLRLLENEELNVWSAWKEDERWTAHTQATLAGDNIGLFDCRAPGMGRRLLLPSSTMPHSLPDLQDVGETSLEAYTLRRYIRGIPEGQAEIPAEESLPMNYNIDLMNGIDFKKGCYVGQELTIRTHHTGVVRRRVMPVALFPTNSMPPAELAFDPTAQIPALAQDLSIAKENAKKRPSGKLIANVGNVGLAMCRLEQMSDLVVSGEGSSFVADDKFLLYNGDETNLAVKAFVPDWMRGRIREPKLQKRVT